MLVEHRCTIRFCKRHGPTRKGFVGIRTLLIAVSITAHLTFSRRWEVQRCWYVLAVFVWIKVTVGIDRAFHLVGTQIIQVFLGHVVRQIRDRATRIGIGAVRGYLSFKGLTLQSFERIGIAIVDFDLNVVGNAQRFTGRQRDFVTVNEVHVIDPIEVGVNRRWERCQNLITVLVVRHFDDYDTLRNHAHGLTRLSCQGWEGRF